MKYSFEVHEFVFNKIKSGARKVGVHLFDKQSQQVKIRDVLVMVNAVTKEKLECEVKGLAIFENFSDLVDGLTPQLIGYKSKEEVMVRLNRLYPKEQQLVYNVIGIFLKPLDYRWREIARDEIER